MYVQSVFNLVVEILMDIHVYGQLTAVKTEYPLTSVT